MSKKLKILSITGGGIRGIIPAAILAYMESYINRNNDEDSYISISELFDFVAGNSTGSIVAASSIIPSTKDPNKPMYKMQEIVDNYYNMGPQVFHASFFRNIKTLYGLFGPKYDIKELEKNFNNQFLNYRLSDLTKPCMFTSYDIKTGHPRIYTNSDENKKYNNYLVKDVVRASTSVPTYFKPAYFKYNNDINTMVDGGVYANNPSLCALIEVSKTKFNNKPPQQYNPEDILLVSIGTGYKNINEGYDYKKSKRWGKVQWVLPVINVMLSAQTEAITYQLLKLFSGAHSMLNFKYINPVLNYSNYDFTDASKKNIDNLLLDAKTYIEKNKYQLNLICDDLILNS